MTAQTNRDGDVRMTVGHFVAQMPQVYAAPMMIPHTEMAAGSAIASRLPAMAPIAAASSM